MSIRLSQVFLILFIPFQGTCTEMLQFDDSLFNMQYSVSKCVLEIAKTYFEEGSIIGISTAGLKLYTNKKLPINTNNVITEELMQEIRWNLIIKQAKAYTDKDEEIVRPIAVMYSIELI